MGTLSFWGRGEPSSCKGWCVGTGTPSPSTLSVNGTQDQLCFLCLLTSSPVIKTLPGGIVLTIWAVMHETKESRGLVSECADLRFLPAGEEAGWTWHALHLTVVCSCSPGQYFPGFKRRWLFSSALVFSYSWCALARCHGWGGTPPAPPHTRPADLEVSSSLITDGLLSWPLASCSAPCLALLSAPGPLGDPLECLT